MKQKSSRKKWKAWENRLDIQTNTERSEWVLTIINSNDDVILQGLKIKLQLRNMRKVKTKQQFVKYSKAVNMFGICTIFYASF